MNDESREQVGLFRFKVISPVLAEPGRVKNDYFRQMEMKEHNVPHYGFRRYTVSTFKAWLKRYREHGFEGLKPKERADRGAPRKLTGEILNAIKLECKLYPDRSGRLMYEALVEKGLLGEPPVCYNTLLRTITREKLLPKPGRTDKRKRFETAEIGELWICDFMHGPSVRFEGKSRKAILCAIIDDHSRMIVGYAFSVHETVSALTVVMKEAFVTYGIPKRFYVDNGSAFSSGLMLKACAQAGISLIHSKPYDSPSRGKIERFFRTVRDRFLPGLQGMVTLDEVNLAFSCWLQEDYHHRNHTGISQRPIDRYHASANRVEIRRLSSAELDQAFLVRHERVVNHDATISFKGRIYEVPAAYIRQRVEIRHTVDDDETITLYDNGNQVCVLKQVDVQSNARSFKPSVESDSMSFSKKKVKK
jgi:putative transposase